MVSKNPRRRRSGRMFTNEELSRMSLDEIRERQAALRASLGVDRDKELQRIRQRQAEIRDELGIG
jgi:hypothetical protein